jgi:uncharacterized membrane protein YraQ (UPF0718 family)
MFSRFYRENLGNRIDVYRFSILLAAVCLLLSAFWFLSRYPALFKKYEHLGQLVPTMAYGSELFKLTPDLPIWQKILYSTANWLDGMKIGMSFGVVFGALIHTYLRYFPITFGTNSYLNSIKGALIGAPMGVCANCSVPVACGLTRGKGRVEVALGFLFSSPNFNPVVLSMTFLALPLAMSLTKYFILLGVIVLVVPALINYFERNMPLQVPSIQPHEPEICEIPAAQPENFLDAAKDLFIEFGKHLWSLFKPTITIMLLSALLASTMLVLIPWSDVLASTSPLTKLLVSLFAVIMPVPIALDVMFASQLQQQGVASGYVMMFAMTLGSYSIIPSIYLWREVSRKLSVSLFVFFVAIGWIVSLIF